MSHLGDRVAALVDGELDHGARDRALSHIAHCADCRAQVEHQRALKDLLASATTPPPSPQTVAGLLSLAGSGGPLPPRARTMPRGPVVPHLPPPGRRSSRGRPVTDRAQRRRPGERSRAHRVRLVAAGALSVAGLVLGTAFVAGGSSSTGPVVPPVAELSVEHGRTSGAVTVGDPGVGLMTSFDTPVPAGTGPTAPSR